MIAQAEQHGLCTTCGDADAPPIDLATLYDRIESAAAEVERDEQLLKEGLARMIKNGENDRAVEILRYWQENAPRVVLETYAEDFNVEPSEN